MIRSKIMLAALPTLMAFAGCPSKVASNSSSSNCNLAFKPSSGKGTPLATIGSDVITVEDLKARLNNKPNRAHLSDKETLRRYLDREIQSDVLVNEALSAGYLNREDVLQKIRRILEQTVISEQIAKNKPAIPAEEEVRAYYEANPKEFNSEEKRRVMWSLVPFGTDKAKAQQTAKKFYAEVLQVIKSKDKNKINELFTPPQTTDLKSTKNETAFLTADELKEKFGAKASEAIWKLDTAHELSPLVEDAAGYYVFMQSGKRDAIKREFETAKATIERKIQREKQSKFFADYIDGLKKKQSVKIHEESMGELEVLANNWDKEHKDQVIN